MSKRVLLATAALLGGLVVSTGANAATILYTVGDATSGSFGNAKIAKGNFTDTVSFTLADAGLFSASLTSAATKIGKTGDLDFTSVVLSGVNGTYDFTTVKNGGDLGLTDSAGLTASLLAGNYTITIMGKSFGNAQYGGNSTVTPVPESATWMMMLGGFGALGATMRRRRTSLTFA